MSEQKSHQFRPPLYHRRSSSGPVTQDIAGGSTEKAAKEQQGWDAYRKWLSQVGRKPAPGRTRVDHSIYSWKGYQNWADKVRQSWKPEES